MQEYSTGTALTRKKSRMERKMSDKPVRQIFVAMNEDGRFECATAADDAAKYLHENYGGEMCRIVVIDVMMSPPKLIDVEWSMCRTKSRDS